MPITIPCPKCNAGLKLPDSRLLGKRGRCPRCEHRFVLKDPDEVELTLAEPEAPPQPPLVEDAPLMGTSAKWVPDEAPAADEVPPAPPVVPDPVSPSIAPPPVLPPSPEFPDPGPVAAEPPSVAGEASDPFNFSDPAPVDAATRPGKSAVRRRRRKQRRGRNSGPILVGAVTAVVVFCLLIYWWQQSGSSQVKPVSTARSDTDSDPQTEKAWQEEVRDRKQQAVAAASLDPTSGDVVPLEYLPFTPHVICHLRPSEIWSSERRNQEFVAVTFDLGAWLADRIRDVTRFEPKEIAEVTFAVNFGARTSEPTVAAVVRLLSEPAPSELQMNRFRGQLRSDLDGRVYENEERIFMMIDTKTFVVAPAMMADETIQAKQFPATPSIEMEVLQRESDRTRMATLMFDVPNIDTHREYIFGEDLHAVADQFVLWFGKDVRTVCWSMQLSDAELYMETLLHPDNESSPLRAERHLKIQLSRLPERLVETARFMRPSTIGYRQLIGRFPAMMKATELGTTTHAGDTFVRMVTLLPSRAGANLAAAALTTWNQSLVTDFSGPTPAVAKGPKIPDTVNERLQLKVIADFRRTPLQEVLDYVSDEIKTDITINGAALKASALTQNLAQSFDLGEVSALKVMDTIFSNPEYRGALVMVVDESTKSIQITTRPVAEAEGLQIYDTKQ